MDRRFESRPSITEKPGEMLEPGTKAGEKHYFVLLCGLWPPHDEVLVRREREGIHRRRRLDY